jgi:hypothetical protein
LANKYTKTLNTGEFRGMILESSFSKRFEIKEHRNERFAVEVFASHGKDQLLTAHKQTITCGAAYIKRRYFLKNANKLTS